VACPAQSHAGVAWPAQSHADVAWPAQSHAGVVRIRHTSNGIEGHRTTPMGVVIIQSPKNSSDHNIGMITTAGVQGAAPPGKISWKSRTK
jgi:hypothetical protein